MTTAILMSGQARSFGGIEPPPFIDGLPNPICDRPWARGTFLNQKWYLYRQLGDVEFFCSLADDAQAKEVEPLLLAHYPKEKVHVEIVKQPKLPEPPLVSTFHGAYQIASPFQSILRDLWHRNRVWEFYNSQFYGVFDSGGSTHTHERIVRLRPDTFFQTCRLPKHFQPDRILLPFWGSYGGCSDRFAVMSRHVAHAYFSAFTCIDRLIQSGCPMHPETLTDAAIGMIEPSAVIKRVLDVHFLTLRRNGDIAFQRLDDSVLGYIEAGLAAVSNL